MNIVKVKGELRSEFGKSSTNKERKSGVTPAVLYGGNETIHFTLDPIELKDLVYTPDFKLAEVNIGDKTYKTIIKSVQFHPISEQILHVDFLKLIDKTPVKLEIPLRFKGVSPGVKVGGKLLQQVRKVKIKTTPEYLVDELKADISKLELGQSLRVKDIIVPEGIQVMLNSSIPVALIEIPRSLRAAAAAAAKAAEPKGKKKK